MGLWLNSEQTYEEEVIKKLSHGSSPPPNFRGNLKIPDQNNWEGDLSKKFGGT